MTIAFLVALALNLSPYLRGPDEWRWAYALPGKPARLAIPAATLALYLVLVSTWTRHIGGEPRPPRWHTWGFLACLVLAVPLVQASLLALDHQDILRPLFYRTVSPSASGVFSVGSTIEDEGEFLRHYPTLMPTFPVHPQRYPPGLPLLFYLARRLLERAPALRLHSGPALSIVEGQALSDALGFHLRRYQCQDLVLMRLPNATISSAVIQMALPLVSGLTLLPLYGLAKRVYDRRTAAWAVALYPLVPSFALWSARWEQFYPLLASTAWYFFYLGLTRPRRSALLAAGITLSIASLLNFGLLALLLPMGLFALLWLATQMVGAQHAAPLRSLRPAICGLPVFLAGLASLWVVYQLAFGTGFLDIWRVSMSYHLGLNRGYWTWLGYHLYDFFVFLGLPLALLFLAALVKATRDLRQRRYDALTLGFALGLLLLDLSGTSRGEVARVWLFLTPFAALVAARGLARLHPPAQPTNQPAKKPLRRFVSRFHSRERLRSPETASCQCYSQPSQGYHAFVLVALLLALQLFTCNTFLRVVTTGLADPPAREHRFEPPPIVHPLNVRFTVDGTDAIALLGYDLEPGTPAPGSTLHLTLYWQALRPLSRPYTVFTHLVGPDGQLAGQQDHMPLQDTVPTTCWLPGEVVADPYDIPVSDRATPGDYVLETGFYLWETGERLPATGPAATSDGRVILSQVRVGGGDE